MLLFSILDWVGIPDSKLVYIDECNNQSGKMYELELKTEEEE